MCVCVLANHLSCKLPREEYADFLVSAVSLALIC